MDGRFVVISGSKKGDVLRITPGKKIIVGRDKECDFRLIGRMISRKHFVVFQDGDHFLLEDLGSRNGIYVNDEKEIKHVLQDGDLVQVGQVHLRFDLGLKRDEMTEQDTPEIIEEGTMSSTAIYRMKFGIDAFDSISEDDASIEKREEHSRLMSICNLSSKLFSTKSVTALLGVALEAAIELTGGERSSALLIDPISGNPTPVAMKFCDTHYCGAFPISKTIVTRTLNTGESVITGNASADERFSNGDSVAIDNISSVMCVPLMTLDTKVIGVLYIDSTTGFEAFDKLHLALLAAIAHQAAVAVERARLFEDLEKLFIGSIHTLTASIEAKDEYTCGHSERVTCYSLLIADEMGLDNKMRDIVELAGIMHDVGKIGIPESVLCSTGKLTEEEFRMMQTHPVKGAEIIQKMPEISTFVSGKEVAIATLSHHERYDGTGYPHGLQGEEIPLISRILAVADTFDAITSDRSYRKGRDAKTAMKILSACAGIQVDAEVFKAFESAYLKGKINWLEAVNVHFNLNVQRLRENTVFNSEHALDNL